MNSCSSRPVTLKIDETQDNDEYDFRNQLLVGLVEKKLRNLFHQSFSKDPNKLFDQLKKLETKIKNLHDKKKNIINDDQYNLLLPTNITTVDSDDFDVTLLCVLIKNICKIKKSSPAFKTIATVLRSRNYVNHTSKLKVSEQDFNRIYSEAEQPLRDLGATQSELDHVKNVRIIDKRTKEEIEQMQRMQQSNIAFNYNYSPPVGNFFSRDAEIQDLHEKLINSKDPDNPKLGVALSAFGGFGKTETCREYWKRYKGFHENIIIWINSESVSSMENAFYDIANRCGMNGIQKADGTYKPIKEVVYLVYDHFSKQKDGHTNRKVLFIMDNLNEPNIIQDFLPTSSNVSPYILITSQCKYWDNRFEVSELKVFSEQESIEFMENNLVGIETDESIVQLVQYLGYHPLALQQAISYINKNYTAVGDYLELFKKRKELFAEPTDEFGNPSVYTTISLALTRLQEKKNPNALDLLDIMSHLDGKDIRKGLLLNFVDKDHLYELNNALMVLQKYSFVNVCESKIGKAIYTQKITIHSLIQSFLCDKQLKEGTFQNVIKKIANFFKIDTNNRVSDNQLRLLGLWYHHFIHIFEKNEESKNILLVEFFKEKNLLFKIFKVKGNYQKANKTFEEMYILQTEKEATEEDLMSTKWWIASSLLKLNKYDEALHMLEEVQNAIGCNRIGAQGELYLETKHNIALCLMKLKKYNEALLLFREIEKILLETDGNESQSCLTTKHNIASCLLYQMKYDEALSLFNENEKILFRTVGDQDELFLKTRHNIARCLLERGKYDKALSIFKEVKEVHLQTIGDESELFLKTKHNIARCLFEKGECDDALSIFREVEKARLQTIGDKSELYLETIHEIERCLTKKRKYNDAL